MKIGLPKEFFGEGISHDVKTAVFEAAERMKNEGAEFQCRQLITHLRLTILFLLQKLRQTYPVLMEFVMDTEQTALRISMTFTKRAAVKALEKRLKGELCLEPLLFHRDIMMRIIKKHCKSEVS